jgi:hypothetical protein
MFEGYKKIAVSEERNISVTASFNPENKKHYFIIDRVGGNPSILGPISKEDFPMLIHCLKDVQDMKGRYTYIEE